VSCGAFFLSTNTTISNGEGIRRNILVVGSGGREHAIAWKCLDSPSAGQVFVAPGNGGLAKYSVPINVTEIEKLADFAERNDCFTIVGPELPLSLGIVDQFRTRGLQIFGPTREQARLESSKAFAKCFMKEHNIPTPEFGIFEDSEAAVAFAKELDGQVAVKADGLAGGKGVFVCSNSQQAETAIRAILDRRSLGDSGNSVVIEEKLRGREVSFMSLCDGRTSIPFGTATDHKRLYDGDEGPNTGGMGACSPSARFGEKDQEEIMSRVIEPVVRATEFSGFLFAGLMITEDGPKVLEFNVRLGDPETQAILPRLESDFLLLVLRASGKAEGVITEGEIRWSAMVSCCVAMCAEGYPEKPRIGDKIHGLESGIKGITFHGGTRFADGEYFTNGGRVLYVTALAHSSTEACELAYSDVRKISWRGEQHRTDIGRPKTLHHEIPI